MSFTAISKDCFNSIFYGRIPFAKLFSEEIEWLKFQSNDVILLAVVLFDKTDKDLNAVVLGRDLRRKYRAIDIVVSKNNKEELIGDLNGKIEKLVAAHADGLFVQGDEATSAFGLFTHRLHPKKRNRYLKLLDEEPGYFPARVMMEELAYWFHDPDGTFIRAMQGNEFNARLFELYLSAMFYELDFESDRTHPQPDFLLKKMGKTVSVEAVTVAEEGVEHENKAINIENFMQEIALHAKEEMPFRFFRSLRKKVEHRPEPLKLPYWDLSHTRGHPFIIAIHDYSRSHSMSFSESALRSLLFGISFDEGVLSRIERHEKDGRTIPSNFFGNLKNKNISAVLLVTQATIPKFNRIGRVAGLRSPVDFAFVSGVRTDSKGVPKPFSALVEHPSYSEYWHEGTYLYHNPNAENPVDEYLFSNIAQIKVDQYGMLERYPPNFTLRSTTQMMKVDPDKIDDIWNEFEKTMKDQTG
jgi:hypothetical protein